MTLRSPLPTSCSQLAGLGVTLGSFDWTPGRAPAGQPEVVERLFMSVWLRTVPPSWSLRIPPAFRLCPFWELTLTANEEFDANFMLPLP